MTRKPFAKTVPAPAPSHAAAADNMDRKLTVDELADFLEHVDNFDVNTVSQRMNDQQITCLDGLNQEIKRSFGYKFDNIDTHRSRITEYSIGDVPNVLRQFRTPRDLQNFINKKIDAIAEGKEDGGECDILEQYYAQKCPKDPKEAQAFEKKLEEDIKAVGEKLKEAYATHLTELAKSQVIAK